MANFEDLMEEVILEILLRLPLKSMGRCKSVSKEWFSIVSSIVSSPVFRRIHTSRSIGSRSIGYATGLIFMKSEELKSLNQQVHVYLPLISGQITQRIIPRITSSSGGLMLLQSKPKPSGFTDYIVCNPTTNEFKQLPLAPPPITGSPHVLPYLAFDPCKSPHYKILFLCLDKDFSIDQSRNGFEFVIYSSETERFSSPKQLPITCLNYSFHYFIYGGYCNDAMHWISDEKDSFYYFDLNTEIMKHGPLPHDLRYCSSFAESRGHLLLVAILGSEICVYKLKSDYSGWSVKFRISIDLMRVKINKFPDGDNMSSRIWRRAYNVLSIVVDREDEENLMLVLIVYGYFVAYNCKRKQFVMLGGGHQMRELRDYRIRHDERLHSWHHIETLACV